MDDKKRIELPQKQLNEKLQINKDQLKIKCDMISNGSNSLFY